MEKVPCKSLEIKINLNSLNYSCLVSWDKFVQRYSTAICQIGAPPIYLVYEGESPIDYASSEEEADRKTLQYAIELAKSFDSENYNVLVPNSKKSRSGLFQKSAQEELDAVLAKSS
jgi:hypothetical protein